MELHRIGTRLMCALVVPLLLTAACQAAAGGAVPPGTSPAERHRWMAAGKERVLRRGTGIAVMPATVVDVSGYDATYYRIALSIDEHSQSIDGRMTMRARARVDDYTAPTLHFISEMLIDSVHSFGVDVVWSHVNSLLYVTLNSPFNTGEEFELTVWYHGQPPQEGDYDKFLFDMHDGVPMIATLSQPYMAHGWWPCKDTPSDKADSVDIIATVNSDFYVVSNGVLRDSVDNGNGTTTYSWHEGYPIATYLVSLAITNYDRFDLWYHFGPGDADSMPVRFYSYPELLGSALTHWPITVDQMEFFAALFGEYPFATEKYGMAHTEWGGAMEHQTATSVTAYDYGFDPYLIGHELSHMWWGDMITCRDWNNIWLNEGFASYCEALWEEETAGWEAYQAYMEGMKSYQLGSVFIYDTTGPIFAVRVYDKGAWVLHMLRGIVGDSTFFAILWEYAHDPDLRYKDAVTEDFRDIAEMLSGLNLHEFFQDWIYGTELPWYFYSWTGEPRTEDNFFNVHVHIRQNQTTVPLVFDMPIELKLMGLGGEPVHRVWNTKREQDFVLIVPKLPTSIVPDPDEWIFAFWDSEAYALNLVTETLVPAIQYLPYVDTLLAKGGTPPYQYTVVNGTLPQGLDLDSETGEITGIPLEVASAPITFCVTDAGAGSFKEKELVLTVAGLGYRPGDLNGDLFIDALDLSLLIDYLFAGAPGPPDVNATDLNGDCQPDALDLAYMIDHLFSGGSLPQPGCIE